MSLESFSEELVKDKPTKDYLREFTDLVEDFKSNCGYNTKEAKKAAKNALFEEIKNNQY